MQTELDLIAEIQKKKAQNVKEEDAIKDPRILLAVTVIQNKDIIKGGGILYDLHLKNSIDSWISPSFINVQPYIPTFLSLRNKTPISKVIEHFKTYFDVLLIEGAGIQHPRYCGLASELGVDLNVPTIGVTKNSLYGTLDFSQSLDKYKPNFEVYPVFDKNRLIAYFVKKTYNKSGIFLSIGHLFTLDSAVELIIPLLQFRIPEPLRLVKQLLKVSK